MGWEDEGEGERFEERKVSREEKTRKQGGEEKERRETERRRRRTWRIEEKGCENGGKGELRKE